jgi:hypothetical protein
MSVPYCLDSKKTETIWPRSRHNTRKNLLKQKYNMKNLPYLTAHHSLATTSNKYIPHERLLAYQRSIYGNYSTFFPEIRLQTLAIAPTRDVIVISPERWLNGNQPDKERLREYFYEFEIPYQEKIVNQYVKSEDAIKAVNGLYKTYQTNFSQTAQSSIQNFNRPLRDLNNLVQNINKFLAGTLNLPDIYANDLPDSWKNMETALKAMHGMTSHVSLIAPKSRHQFGIPTIAYASVKDNAPKALWRLVRDIYISWRAGSVFDRRTPQEIQNQTITSDIPGALRGWHMNMSEGLPALPNIAVPVNAQPIFQHYKNTSKVMNIIGQGEQPQGPIGYAEYTGSGIMDDLHYSKIVLDYLQGRVYVTVSHYQNWLIKGNAENTNDYKAVGQNPGQGEFSAWFYIKM